jgi:GTP-binding protein Era
VALVGRTNVGKSTLLNRLMNFPLAVITPKPQTTRHRIAGILTRSKHQIVFLDTPGLLEPRYALQQAMMRATRKAMADADLLLYLVEAGREPGYRETLDPKALDLLRAGGKGLLAINKVDLVRKEVLLPQLGHYHALGVFAEMVPISALTGDGVPALEAALARHLPLGPPLYPSDQLTDRHERFLAGEIIRGVVLELYGQEIPYSTTVDISEFREGGAGHKDHLEAAIYVERESQKGILIGKGGGALKRVGIVARSRIEEVLGRAVHLELRVKVRTRWRRKPRDVSSFGY